MRPRALRIVLAALAALLPATAAAQESRVALSPVALSPVALLHGFPLAGGTLVIVVDGLPAGAETLLKLHDAPSAPISMIEALSASASPQFHGPVDVAETGVLASVWGADERGRIVLEVALDDPRDSDHVIQLTAVPWGGEPSAPLILHVQPPTLVLPAQDGYARLSLLDGRTLTPAIPAAGGLQGVSFSEDGARAFVLRDAGVLQVLAARDWAGPPLSTRLFDDAADLLAGGPAGAAFLLARPGGLPFPDAGQVVFVDGEAVRLEPMAQPVGARRVAVSEDGLTAFVAEDDLVVREVDLRARQPRALLPVGQPGDSAIADVLLDGRLLLVATRDAAGRSGTLTTFDLDTGVLATLRLAADPARLLALGGGRVLVVPAAGGVVELLEHGVTAGRIQLAGNVLDAAATPTGVLLLVARPDGQRLFRLDPATLRFQSLPLSIPSVTRLVGAPAGLPGVVVLLGDPSGAVHIWRSDRSTLETVPGLVTAPDAAFSLLP